MKVSDSVLSLDSAKETELKDIWYALDYQDRRINKLVEENNEYKERVKFAENKLDGEVKDLKKQIQGIKYNLESIVDIVKVFQNQFEQLRENKKKQRLSQSPRVLGGNPNNSCTKNKIFMSNRMKNKKVKKTRPVVTHQAALTDTESTRMHDLLKKGYVNQRSKKTYLTSKPKSNSISGPKIVKNKLKSVHLKNASNSRSPIRADSQSTESNRKIKSTLASTDLRRSHALRNSGESMSIASEKPKAAYFKNTLDSHNKIGPGTMKSCGFYKSNTVDAKTKTLKTPVQNVKLYTNETSSNNEIEENLPQMMRFFDAEGKYKQPNNNVIQYQLDLSEGFIASHKAKPTRSKK